MEKKKTIVLLHGFGEDHKVFESQQEALSPYYQVFAPDLPGSGLLNQYPWPDASISIEWLADWLDVFLVSKGITKCIMLGHSMGGYITLAFAEKFPEKLEAFGLIHSTAFADSEEKKEVRRKAILFIKDKGSYAFLKTAIPNLFGKAFAAQKPATIQLLIGDAKNFTPDSLEQYYTAMISRPERTKVLQNATTPVLIIAGEEDLAAPLPDLLKQASMPKKCHFHVLKDTGHMGMLERPLEMNEILLNFMKSI
jgi:pimeloyl-ACP methyl ester carboxylesterase